MEEYEINSLKWESILIPKDKFSGRVPQEMYLVMDCYKAERY